MKGVRSYIVQDITFNVTVTKYLREQWKTPDGTYITAQLPDDIKGGHFGPGLIQYIIYQNQQNRVPEKKIHQELIDKGIQISEGQISNILKHAAQLLKSETNDVLKAGLRYSENVCTDDTGARHSGKNGFCIVIQNDLFSFFKSTDSKSKINFLETLGGERIDYLINNDSLEYMNQYKIKKKVRKLMESHNGTQLEDKKCLSKLLSKVRDTR